MTGATRFDQVYVVKTSYAGHSVRERLNFCRCFDFIQDDAERFRPFVAEDGSGRAVIRLVRRFNQALTAVAAVIAAIAAARYAKSQMESSQEQVKQANAQLALERERDAVAKELEDRKDVSRVSAWVEELGLKTLVVIQNNSDAPVYDLQTEVNCRVWDHQKKRASFPLSELQVKILPPGRYVWMKIPDDTDLIVDLENPNKKRKVEQFEKSSGWTTALYYDSCNHKGTPILNSPNWKINSLTFQDAVNNRWRRDETGFNLVSKNA